MTVAARDEISGRERKGRWIGEIEEALESETGLTAASRRTLEGTAYVLRLSTDPEFFGHLCLAYAREQHMPERAAALAALYGSVVATSDAMMLTTEGSPPEIELDEQDRARVPVWALRALVQLTGEYLAGEAGSLNEAAGLGGGQRGIDVLMLPFKDFEHLVRVQVLRARGVLQELPKRKSDFGAAEEIATFAADALEQDARTGFERSTTLRAVQRVRSVMGKHPYRSPELRSRTEI